MRIFISNIFFAFTVYIVTWNWVWFDMLQLFLSFLHLLKVSLDEMLIKWELGSIEFRQQFHSACFWVVRTPFFFFSFDCKPKTTASVAALQVVDWLLHCTELVFLSFAVILCIAFIQKVSFRILYNSQKERHRMTEEERLIEGTDRGNRGHIEQEYTLPCLFGSLPLKSGVPAALFNCASLFIIKTVRLIFHAQEIKEQWRSTRMKAAIKESKRNRTREEVRQAKAVKEIEKGNVWMEVMSEK